MRGKRFGLLALGVVGVVAVGGVAVLTLAYVVGQHQHQQMQAAGPAVNPANFVGEVNNPLFPLQPGTTFFYEGKTAGVPTTSAVFAVTHQHKRLLGVNCLVVHDQTFEHGVLVEDTFDFFAQDTAGTVWYFGEDSKALDAGGHVISTAGSWQAGVNGALPGIIMLANPHQGDRYQQEFATGVAEDRAEVLSLNASTTVPYGTFADVLLTSESTPLERGAAESKYYAKGVGVILEVAAGGNERTELVRISTDGSGH